MMNTQYTMNTQYSIPTHLLQPGEKTELVVFSFIIDGISAAARTLINHAIEHPWLFGIEAGLIIGGVLFLLLPAIVGFGPLGPVSGGMAAMWQGWIGNVVKGGLFAILQRLTMTGVFKTLGLAMIAAGIALDGVIELLPPKRDHSGAYYGGGIAGDMGTAAMAMAAWVAYFGV